MQPLLAEILRRCAAGERVALCTVVATRGSTPQQRGAKMLLAADGRTVGTLGGGCVEAEVRRNALELLSRGESRLMEFKLDHDYGWDDGLICGGVMDIHIWSIRAEDAGTFEALSNAMREQRPCELRIVYEQHGQRHEFVEPIRPAPRLVIAGAGHVGQALADLAAKLDFRITVIDDRADFASEARFPSAEHRLVGEIEHELRHCGIDHETYVVIVTRGHNRDGAALAAVIDSPARYIGLIGSKRKIKTLFDDLHARGVKVERLQRVHAPIGLDIGAVSVNEIAVSIAAEMVAVRHDLGNKPVRAMKMDESELMRWLMRREPEAIPPPPEHL